MIDLADPETDVEQLYHEFKDRNYGGADPFAVIQLMNWVQEYPNFSKYCISSYENKLFILTNQLISIWIKIGFVDDWYISSNFAPDKNKIWFKRYRFAI